MCVGARARVRVLVVVRVWTCVYVCNVCACLGVLMCGYVLMLVCVVCVCNVKLMCVGVRV